MKTLYLNIDEKMLHFFDALIFVIKERAEKGNIRPQRESGILIGVSEETSPSGTIFHAIYTSDEGEKEVEKFKDNDVEELLTIEILKGNVSIRIPCPCGCVGGYELANFNLRSSGVWQYGIASP